MNATTEATKHSKAIAKDCISRARSRWGTGWGMLSRDQQENAIWREIGSVLLSQTLDHPADSLIHVQNIARIAIYSEE